MATCPPITHNAAGQLVTIRCALERDAEQVIAHRVAVTSEDNYFLSQRGEFSENPSDQRAWIRRQTEGGTTLVLVAMIEEDGCEQLVGLADFASRERQRIRHRGMFGISIRPSMQGKGLGRAMIGRIIEWARESEPIEIVALGCFAANVRALKLYREMGFVEERREIDAFKLGPGRYHDDVIMTMRVKDRF